MAHAVKSLQEGANLLILLAERYTKRQRRLLQPFDLTPTQYRIFAQADQAGMFKRYSISAIAAEVEFGQPAVTKTMRALEKRGLVLFEADENDQRTRYVVVTSAGRDALRQIHMALEKDFQAMFSKLATAELVLFAQAAKLLIDWMGQNAGDNG